MIEKLKPVKIYISEERLQKRIAELASEISRDYNGEEVVVLAVLNGAFLFCSDLIRKIDSPVDLQFITASSYGNAFESSGKVDLKVDGIVRSLEGRHVLIVEDIVDTGRTLSKLKLVLEEHRPKSLKLASLLHKPSHTLIPITIDYLGFEIEDVFVIGYGLDYLGKYRELPFVGLYQEEGA